MKQVVEEFLFKEETYTIIGACFEVYNEKGCGFLEPVYQECLDHELQLRAVPFIVQPPLALTYKGRKLKHTYQPDFICYDKIILEIKAVSEIIDEHRAQLINYLNATNFKVGLLVNFGSHPKVEYERFALSSGKYQRQSALSAGN